MNKLTEHLGKNQGKYTSGFFVSLVVTFFALPVEHRPVLGAEYQKDRTCDHIHELQHELDLAKIERDIARLNQDEDEESDSNAKVNSLRNQLLASRDEHTEC